MPRKRAVPGLILSIWSAWRKDRAQFTEGEARPKTAGINEISDRSPNSHKPFVLQTSLSDFYVEYQLNAYLEQPEARLPTLAALHANIQDAFNEYGVQIMSPHYESDPAEKVWVPKEKWFEAPAKLSEQPAGPRKEQGT